MSSFSVFEYAYKKATRNGRSRVEAMVYALNKYFIDLCDSLHLGTDEETQKCVVEEAIEEYCAAGRAGDTHEEAAKDATYHIERTVKDAIKKDRGKTCPEKANTSSRFPKREPLHDYKDMYESLPKPKPLRSHTDRSSHAHAGRRPSHYENPYHTPHRSHASRPAAFYAESSVRPAPPIPSGTGRFNFPEPEYRAGETGPTLSHTTHGFRPSHNSSRHSARPGEARPPTGPSRAYTTDEFRPSSGATQDGRLYSTNELRPSHGGWLGGDAPRRSGLPTESWSYFSNYYSSEGPPMGYEYSSTLYTQSSYSDRSGQAPHTHSSYSYSTGPPPHTPPPRSYQYFEPSPHTPPPHSYHTFQPSNHSNARPPTPLSDGTKPAVCFYIVLGILRTATADEINKAYHKISLKHHPDRSMCADKTKATAKMAEINQANDVLGDPEKRDWYDRTGCVPAMEDK